MTHFWLRLWIRLGWSIETIRRDKAAPGKASVWCSMDDHPGHPQAIADRQNAHYRECPAQYLLGARRNPEVQQNSTYTEQRVAGHHDEQQHSRQQKEGLRT